MPIAYIQSSSNRISANHISNVVAFPAKTNTANLLLCLTAFRSNITVSSVTDNAANVYTSAAGPVVANQRSQMFYAQGASAGANLVSVIYSGSSAASQCFVAEYSGMVAVGALDVIAVGSSLAAGSSLTTASLTIGQDEELLFCGVGSEATNTTPTSGGGFLNRSSVVRAGIEDQSSVVVGTFTGGWVWNIVLNDGWQCLLATFKAATAGAVAVAVLDESYVMVA